MTAAQLRSVTAGHVLACSPVALCDDQGRRFEVVGHEVATERATDTDGKERAAGVPVLTLLLRQVAGDPAA